jgi:hypothetical protein
MKRFVSLSLIAFILLAPGSSAFAWGDDGHQTVGKIASLRIKKKTSEKIAAILKPGETLANIASWADTVKDRMGKTDPDPDTNEFLQDLAHNENNREWHYDDLPLNCKSYQDCAAFTNDQDIVHMMNVSIRTLQGYPDPKHPLSKRNALKLLVHFLGDIHQPLHVGCGFIDVNGPNGTILIVKDPAIAAQKKLPHDKGGNDLVIDNDRKNLHSFWDFTLVTNLLAHTGQDMTSDTLGEFLRQSVKPKNNWNPQGKLNTWAAQWATDSLHLSRNQTYRGVRITGKRTIPVLSKGQPLIRDGQPVMMTVYDIVRPNDYETVTREVAREQLAKGGYRLAKVLDAIYQ